MKVNDIGKGMVVDQDGKSYIAVAVDEDGVRSVYISEEGVTFIETKRDETKEIVVEIEKIGGRHND